MNDEAFAALVAVAEELKRTCNTPELATKQLQKEGILDADGHLARPYWDPSVWL